MIVHPRVTKTHAFSFQEPQQVFSDATIVFRLNSFSEFSILQSVIHEVWASHYSSSMKGDRRYTPSDCFETFPFPSLSFEDRMSLEIIGKKYFDFQKEVMLTENIGLTELYNRVNDPKINQACIHDFRCCIIELNLELIKAYGWNEIEDASHDFYPSNSSSGYKFTLDKEVSKQILISLQKMNRLE